MLSGAGVAAAATITTSTVIADDSFNRTVGAGFGSADTGGSYTMQWASPNTSGTQSVKPGGGTLAAIRPGTSVAENLNAVSSSDTSVFETVTLPSLTSVSLYHSLTTRLQSNGSHYNSKVHIASNGALQLSFSRSTTGGETMLPGLVNSPVTLTAGHKLRVKTTVSGTSPVLLHIKVWLEGSTEPTTWQANASDASSAAISTAGAVGTNDYVSGSAAATTVNIAAFSATSNVTTTTPPVVTPPSSTAGSLPVGKAAYAIPSGAVFVSRSGSDSGTGSVSSPFATVAKANATVAVGGTIVLRAGDYNEDIRIAKNGVTVQNYPGEAAWMDGSIAVSSWTQSGSTWVHSGWGYQFDSSASFTSGSNAGGFVNAAHPMAAHPDQVFSDGVQLAQVAANPAVGQFAVDYAADTITIGSNPSGHAMRASNLGQAFVVAGGNVTIRGIGVENYATSMPQIGTIYFGGSVGHELVENVDLENNASQAMSVDIVNSTINHVTFSKSGMTGIHANHADGLLVENSRMSGNNVENFNTAPATSGIKVSRTNGLTIKDNTITGNINSEGIWTDENVIGFSITGNTVTNNGPSYGIEVELSDTGIIADNTVSGAKYGITPFDSGNVKIVNNTVSNSTVWDIGLTQDNRYQPGKGTAGPNVQPSPACPWKVHNILVENNIVANDGSASSTFQFYALDKQTNIPADDMAITINGNLFTASNPAMVGWGSNNNSTVTMYKTPSALQAAKNTSWNNAQATTATTTVAQQQATAASATNAVALTSDVAAAVGQPTGTKHIGTF